MASIHLWASTHHAHLSGSGLPHSIGFFFLVPHICIKISRCHCFILLSSTSLYKCTAFSLSIFWLRGIQVVSSFWLLQITLLLGNPSRPISSGVEITSWFKKLVSYDIGIDSLMWSCFVLNHFQDVDSTSQTISLSTWLQNSISDCGLRHLIIAINVFKLLHNSQASMSDSLTYVTSEHQTLHLSHVTPETVAVDRLDSSGTGGRDWILEASMNLKYSKGGQHEY